MSQAKSITEVLADLILQRNVPLRAVAIAGEAVAADARLSDHPEGPTKRTTGPELHELLETYDTLLQRCKAIVKEFGEARDGHALIRSLSEIKQALIELY